MNPSLDPQDTLFEKQLAEVLRDGVAPAPAAHGSAETVARCRARLAAPRRSRVFVRVLAAAAALAFLFGLAWWRVAAPAGDGTPVIAEAPAEPEAAVADEEETVTLASTREAPIADDFTQLESFLVELASIQLSYDWPDEQTEALN